MATKLKTLKDVLLLYSAQDAESWAEFIQNEIKTSGPQIQGVDIKDLASSMADMQTLCAQYSVVSLVISEEMLKTLVSVATELSSTLHKHSYVTLIKLYIEDCEKDLQNNVLPKYPSAKSWKTFTISEPDAQTKLQATVSSLMNMVQDAQMAAQPPPPRDMSPKPSPGSTAKPKQITVSPDSIRQGGETVLVVWYRAIPDSYLVQVAIGENEDAKKIETKRINEYTFSFTAPSHNAGKTHMYVFFDGKKSLKRMIKYSAMCEFAYTFPEFLCQLIGLDAADHTGLDNYLTTVFQSSTPEDGSMAMMLTPRNIILSAGSKKSDCELPTLLHFACKYSLNALASSIIDTPGAHEALEILNCQDKTPYDIAKEMNNEDLIGFIDVFLEMVDYNSQIEDLYTKMKNGQLVDYSNTPTKEPGSGYLSMGRSSPGSYVTGGVPEDDYERTNVTSHEVLEVDEDEDIHEPPSQQAPPVPSRKPSMAVLTRTPERPSPPAVPRTPSNLPAKHVERQQGQPIRPPSLGEAYNPKTMCMMPDDDPMGGKGRESMPPGSMGSSSLNEINEIIESYKLGDICIDDVDKLYRAWQERNRDSSKSIKDKKQQLEKMRSLYEDAGSKKKGGLLTRLTKKKPEKKTVEIEHHVNPGARTNSYCTWEIMKKPSGPHPSSNRDSTASNTSTSSSSSASSQDSALDMIEEDYPVERRPRQNTDTEAKRQSWGQQYLATKQQPGKSAMLPKPPPRITTVKQILENSKKTESPPPVPKRPGHF